jgi:hypothetical protein
MSIEHYDFGITREWIDDGHIAVITTQGDMRRDAVDTWVNICLDTLNNWHTDRPILSIQNLSAKMQGLTPYSSRRSEDILAQIPPHKPCYIALILPNTFISRVIGLFMLARQRFNKDQESRVFTNLGEGLDWLKEKQKLHGSDS